MNNTQLFGQFIMIALGGWLAKNHVTLTSADAQGIAGLLIAGAAALWKITHFNFARTAAFNLGASSSPAPSVPITKGNGLSPTILLFLVLPALLFTGCTFERSRMTINTPAVYNVTTNAGVLQSNLVSAASTKTVTDRERIWLPSGYSLDLVESGYGADFSMIDKTSGNPGHAKVGAWYASQRWTPSSRNQLYSPPVTSSGSVGNSLPFTFKANASFTSGQSQVQDSGTNNAAGAIVPGTPNNQQK